MLVTSFRKGSASRDDAQDNAESSPLGEAEMNQ